jgi:hypothetical protein
MLTLEQTPTGRDTRIMAAGKAPDVALAQVSGRGAPSLAPVVPAAEPAAPIPCPPAITASTTADRLSQRLCPL